MTAIVASAAVVPFVLSLLAAMASRLIRWRVAMLKAQLGAIPAGPWSHGARDRVVANVERWTFVGLACVFASAGLLCGAFVAVVWSVIP